MSTEFIVIVSGLGLIFLHTFAFYHVTKRSEKLLKKIYEAQVTIMRFVLKQYEDELREKTDSRVKETPADPAKTIPPPASTGPGAADPPDPDQVEKKKRGSSPKAIAALKAYNDKRKEEKAAKVQGQPDQAPPPVQAAPVNDSDEELARLLEKHGYKVTRGSAETSKAIADMGGKK